MTNLNNNFIGVDVSKDSLDIFYNNKSFKINNNAEAISAFITQEIDSASLSLILSIMEPTGGYERLVVKMFHDAGMRVKLVHPNKIHAFAKVCGHFAKTDKLDAKLLYQYAVKIGAGEDEIIDLSDAEQKIAALKKLAQSIELQLHAAKCRIKQMPSFCSKYLQEEIDLFAKQLSEISKAIAQHIDEDEDLQAKREILKSMPGVGDKTVASLLAGLPELGKLTNKKISNLVGVVPRTYQSGKKSQSGHIFGGRFYVRKALYMVALVCIRHNEVTKDRYADLLKRGKAKKVALVALMHDIIIQLNAMVKNMQPYKILP